MHPEKRLDGSLILFEAWFRETSGMVLLVPSPCQRVSYTRWVRLKDGKILRCPGQPANKFCFRKRPGKKQSDRNCCNRK